MFRIAGGGVLIITVCILAGAARGDEKARLRDALVIQETLKDAIKKAEPSIACILITKKEADKLKLANADQVPESFGSGVVIDEKGLILTNYHVVHDAAGIFVRLPGDRNSYAHIHAANERSDLAVLALDKPINNLKAIKLGDGDAVEKGDFVLSIANPFAAGFRDGSPSTSWGIISNVRRRLPGNPRETERTKSLHEYGTLLQSDARLNLGCSGGALIDLKGELIGLTTSVAAISGGEVPGGFAIPMNAGMRRVIEVLKQGKEVEYGFLGVSLDRKENQDEKGVRIAGVIRGGPADKAGVHPGDRILEINGKPLRDYDDLFLEVGLHLAGSTVKLKLASSAKEPEVVLVKQNVLDKSIATQRPNSVGGLRVDYTSMLIQPGQGLRIPEIPEGVMIQEVHPGSAADAAKLQKEKVISKVNGKPVYTPADFYREIGTNNQRAELTIVNADGQTYQVSLKLTPP